jgi:hypothetical protein
MTRGCEPGDPERFRILQAGPSNEDASLDIGADGYRET